MADVRGVWTPEKLERLKGACAQGLSTHDMSVMFGVSPSSVLFRIRRHKFPRVKTARVKPFTKRAPSVNINPEAYELYTGEPAVHIPPERLAFLDIPSRIGDKRYYRDGRVEAV